jgi:hypothetical protein
MADDKHARLKALAKTRGTGKEARGLELLEKAQPGQR